MIKLRYAKVTQVEQLRAELAGTLALEVSIDFDEAALEPYTDVSIEDDTPEAEKLTIDRVVETHVIIERIFPPEQAQETIGDRIELRGRPAVMATASDEPKPL